VPGVRFGLEGSDEASCDGWKSKSPDTDDTERGSDFASQKAGSAPVYLANPQRKSPSLHFMLFLHPAYWRAYVLTNEAILYFSVGLFPLLFHAIGFRTVQ
jgi:hypothetical protein